MALRHVPRCFAGLLWVALAVGVAPGDTSAAPARPVPRNIVLVVIDTLRTDHLGTYGYGRPTSPFIDELAAGGVVFENAVSAAPATFPAVNTLLTSVSPHVFNANNAHDLGIPARVKTLAEVFRAAGFRTGAVSASPIVRRSPSRFNHRGGFGQGFDRFDEECGDRRGVASFSADCVTGRALHMLPTLRDGRFFLYVHYLDPHGPYQPPPTWRRFGTAYHGKPFIEAGNLKPIKEWLYKDAPDPGLTESDVQHLRDLYDGEILAVDHNVRRLVSGFRKHKLFSNTLFVIVSDHGESFMDHRYIAHGKSMYQPVIRVPLIFHWSNHWPHGVRRTDLACGVDVMPTILDLAGLRIPKGARGRPLLGMKGWRRTDGRTCYSERRAGWQGPGGVVTSLRQGDDKIIYSPKSDTYEVYALDVDPRESNDLARTEQGRSDPRVKRLREAVRTWRVKVGATRPVPAVALQPEASEALRSLGYIE